MKKIAILMLVLTACLTTIMPAIADEAGTIGATLVVQFGANVDSLKSSERHAPMQAIFKHFIESVKIEPLC